MIANSWYRPLLINSSITITFKLHMLPWQRSEKHRNTTFLQFWVYFSPFNIIFNYRPTRQTISYYEIIMKYLSEILYALVLVLIEETYDCFEEKISHLNSKIYFLAKSEAKIRRKMPQSFDESLRIMTR